LLDEFRGFAKVREGKADYVADKMSMREVLAAKQKRQAIEKLGEFYDNGASKKTVKELLTSTSNIALPTMVQARALLELANWADLREINMIAPVPTGAGKTVDTNIITQPTFAEWTEGSALAAADPTLTKRTCTLKPFGKVTQISDLLANTSAKGTCMHVSVD
jgi:hypothetical protein